MESRSRFNLSILWSVLLLCLILSIGFLFSPFYYTSAKSVGVSITPLKYDISAKPGDVIEQVVTAINPNDFPISVLPEFQDFKLEENGITFIPPDADNPWKMSDWINIQTEPIRLEPKEYHNVPFTITVPENAGSGGHYAAVFFKIVDSGEGEGFGATARVGSLILLNVLGDFRKTGEFIDFQTPIFWNKGPIVFKTSFRNTGTAHYDITAKVSIYNFLGFKKYQTVSETRFITPQVTRYLTAKWEKTWPTGIFKATAVVTDGEGVQHTKTAWFIGFPWVWGLAGLGVLVILYFVFRIIRRKFRIVKVQDR